MEADHDTLENIRKLVACGLGNGGDAGRIAEAIRSARGYRWVGIYDVTGIEIVAIAWTGSETPAHPNFPITRGLRGAAVESRAPVLVGDVENDTRYLTTFGSTRSEIVVPALDNAGKVAGLIDVDSELADAFGDEDTRFLEA